MLIQAGWKGEPDLKIISGGDAMTRETGGRNFCSDPEVWNAYGPTETTIITLQENHRKIPLGRICFHWPAALLNNVIMLESGK